MSVAWTGMSRRDAWRQRSWRHVTVVISVVVHVAVVLVAVAYSFWHVEELSPPSVMVTFVSAAAAPPPPPPPPPLGGGQGAVPKRHAVARPKLEVVPVQPTTPEAPHAPVVEAPKEKPGPVAEAPTPAHEGAGDGAGVGVKGGVPGGVRGGVAGGVVGGVVGAPPHVAAKFLPPQIGAQLKLSGAEPDFPALLRRQGASFVVMAKICVSTSGGVDSVTVQKHADPTLDNNVVAAVKGWHFRPATANGAPVPFCYFGRFEFKSD